MVPVFGCGVVALENDASATPLSKVVSVTYFEEMS